MLSAKEHNADKTKAGSGDPALHHRSPLKTSLLPKMAGAILKGACGEAKESPAQLASVAILGSSIAGISAPKGSVIRRFLYFGRPVPAGIR